VQPIWLASLCGTLKWTNNLKGLTRHRRHWQRLLPITLDACRSENKISRMEKQTASTLTCATYRLSQLNTSAPNAIVVAKKRLDRTDRQK
jgi:hypothetical protein